MTQRYYSSIAKRTTLDGDIASGALTMGVTAVVGWPSSYPYTLIIDTDLETEEVVTVTGRSGLTITMTRGSDGTSASAHTAGAAIQHGVSARDFSEPNTHVNTPVEHVNVVTSGTRPGSPSAGEIIFETDTSLYYGWSGSAWAAIGSGGATGGGTDQVFYENDQDVTTDYTITADTNAMSAGPVTVAAAATITIPSGSVWTVV